MQLGNGLLLWAIAAFPRPSPCSIVGVTATGKLSNIDKVVEVTLLMGFAKQS